MLQLSITGRDRMDFLESLCVADVRGLPEGGAGLSVLLTDKVAQRSFFFVRLIFVCRGPLSMTR